MANAVCELYEEEKVVCPPKLKKEHFTAAAIDKIDHNPSSTIATGSFHGKGISLFQHPSFPGEGTARDALLIKTSSSSSAKCINPLPKFYTSVLPVSMKTKDTKVQLMTAQMEINKDTMQYSVLWRREEERVAREALSSPVA